MSALPRALHSTLCAGVDERRLISLFSFASNRDGQRPTSSHPSTRTSQRATRRQLCCSQVFYVSSSQVSRTFAPSFESRRDEKANETNETSKLTRLPSPLTPPLFSRIRAEEKTNQMSASNLSIVFGPTLFRQPPEGGGGEGMTMADLMSFQCKAVETILLKYEDIFI